MPSEQPVNPAETSESQGGPLAQLPVVYAVAIALQEAGVPMASIADRLELPQESMPTLLEVANAKLAVARRHARDPGAESGPPLHGRVSSKNEEA